MTQSEYLQHLQLGSNLGHWIEGGLFLLVAILGFLEARGKLAGKVRFAVPVLLFLSGAALAGFLAAHSHVIDGNRTHALADPQQREHLIMGSLLVLAGLAEFFRKIKNPNSLLRFVWPVVFAVIGTLFMIHTQHGTHEAVSSSVWIHRVLGATIISGAMTLALDRLTKAPILWLQLLWAILFTATALQLILYREPEGAYHGENETSHHDKSLQNMVPKTHGRHEGGKHE